MRERERDVYCGEERYHKINCCHSLDTLQNKTYGLMLFISTMMNE